MAVEQTIGDDEKILYDILVPEEWAEKTTVLEDGNHKSLMRLITATAGAFSRVSKTIINPLKSLGTAPPPPASLTSIINARLPWQLIMSRDGRQLAVVQDDRVEIRSLLDQFEVARVTFSVGPDLMPQWRRAVWNALGTELAFAASTGVVSVWSHMGQCLHRMPDTGATEGLQEAVAGLSFVTSSSAKLHGAPEEDEDQADEKRLLLVMNYGAVLNTYHLIPGVSKPLCLHCVSLLDYYPSGVGAMEYHSEILIVAGWCEQQDGDAPLVSGWKLQSDSPYWTPLPGQRISPKRKSVISAILNCPRSHPNKEWVFTMAVSPNGDRLATISISGQLTIWNLPSLTVMKTCLPDELPWSSSKSKGAILPVEVSWWSNEALIVANSSSEVTVPSVSSMMNLLGLSPEPGFSITPSHAQQFLMLECQSEVRVIAQRRLLPSFSDDSREESDGVDGELEDEDDKISEKASSTLLASASRISTSIAKPVLYFITEWDQYRPLKKKQKKLCHSYRLICLKAMAPEECYERKMANQEYGEALELARRYELDCDLVYQRQWQQSLPVTVAGIEDYLSHISKISWVLQECVHCVARDFLTMRELLLYGQHVSSFRKLKATGLLAADEYEPLEEDSDCSSDEEEPSMEQAVRDIKALERLSEELMLIFSCRREILTYLDRLNTYEAILGGPVAADDKYDPAFFELFRKEDITKTAVKFAQDGNHQAVETLFNLHGDVVLPHRLPILSCFPETLHPDCYSSLLPIYESQLDGDDCGAMEEWEGKEPRSMDWVEHPDIRRMYSIGRQSSITGGEFIYDETPHWRQYNVSPVTGDLLTHWYCERACEIEKFSGQVDNSLGLIVRGMSNNVQGLDSLCHSLKTLHSLVYFCNVDTHFNLSRLQAMSNIEILQLLMKDVEIEQFVSHFSEHARPFLERVSSRASYPLLEEYMVLVAKDDLRPCRDIIRASRNKGTALELSVEERMSLGLKCIFSCERSDQLDEADAVFECMPVSSAQLQQGELSKLHQELDELEDYLKAVDILRSYDVYKPIHYIRDIKVSSEKVEQLLVKITRTAAKKKPPLTQSGWRSLLQHLITLQSTVFSCIELSVCYQIFAESLLCSGSLDNISFAEQTLTTSLSSEPTTSGFTYSLPYTKSITVLVKAAQEYFNSASSPADETIKLAKYCLSLVEEEHPDIISELNLIASLGILSDFGITILPVQVRLCDNKLDLIRQVLDSSATAYKKYIKVFKLSYLLGLSLEPVTSIEDIMSLATISEGLGHTIIVSTLSAIQNADFRLAIKLCNVLVHSQFADAWEVCSNLAVCDQFENLDARLSLLDFSLCHCPLDSLQHLLAEKKALQMKAMYMDCSQLHQKQWRGAEEGITGIAAGVVGKSSLAVRDIMSRGAGAVGSLDVRDIVSRSAGAVGSLDVRDIVSRSAGAVGSLDVRGIVSRSTGAVQQLMGQRQTDKKDADRIMKECIEGLLKMSSAQQLSVTGPLELKLVYHSFYTPLMKLSLKSNDSCYIQQALLRVLATHTTSSEDTQDMSNAMIQLARQHVDMDVLLFIGYILSLPAPEDGQELFSMLAPTKLTYLMAEYIFSLHLYAGNCTDLHSQPHPYEHCPVSLIEHVLSHVMSSDESDWPDSQQAMVALLKHYRNLLEDHQQATTLEQLRLGIDVQRFFNDAGYKRDKILTLSRNESLSVFNTALSLARRHGVSEWEVCVSQLDQLLTVGKLNAHEVQQKISERDMMKHLLKQPQMTADRLASSVYPKLPKANYGIFFQFFTFLQWCIEKGANVTGLSEQSSISIEAHLKLLKKLKSAIRGVDYRQLVSGQDPLSQLVPALTSSNVHSVAKLASLVPLKGSEYLAADMVFRVFAENLFWDGGTKLENPSSTSGWAHCLESCHDYIVKLGPEQLHSFIKNVVFSEKSLKLAMETRLELLKRLERTCSRRKSSEESDQAILAFSIVLDQVHGCQKHIAVMPSLTRPTTVEMSKWDQVLDQFYLSLSKSDMIQELALSMCCDSFPLVSVERVLSLANSVTPHSLSLCEVVKSTLLKLLDDISSSPDSSTQKHLSGLILVIAMYQTAKGSEAQVTSSDVMEVTREFCSDTSRSPESKRTLLDILNQHLSLSAEDYNTLLLLQSHSILTNQFKTELTVDALSSPDDQRHCFMTLLDQATTAEQLDTLVVLLESWPKSGVMLAECWSRLLEELVSQHPLGADRMLTVRAGLRNLSETVDEQLYCILKASRVHALQLALISSNHSLLTESRTIIKEEDCSNPTTLELVVLQGQAPVYLSTPLYTHLCLYLRDTVDVSRLNVPLLTRLLGCCAQDLEVKLAVNSPWDRVIKVAQQLYDAGRHLEASSLLLSSQQFMPSLSTIPSAINVLTRTLENHK